MENEAKQEPHRVLELFSGIGGMRMALERTGKPFVIVDAIDINPIANAVYNHNFGEKSGRNGNILKLTAEKVAKLRVDTILMSPPCQPFTTNGKFEDLNDRRTDPFRHICDLLVQIPTVTFILMENVKGFQKSQARQMYRARLHEAGFHCQEYVLSPHQFGVPNTRNRYYCIAKRNGMQFKRESENMITEPEAGDVKDRFNILRITQPIPYVEPYLLKPEVLLNYLPILDICTPESMNSMCFTKAYTHYAEGTGSVYSPTWKKQFDTIYADALEFSDPTTKLDLLDALRLRYFTPKEVARLMSFPEHFSFPDSVTDKQRYRLLGNSVNVLVVSILLRELE